MTAYRYGSAQSGVSGTTATVSWATRNTVVQYPLPHRSSEPWSITVSGNGTVWFAEAGGNRIGRMDPVSHQIREFRIPTPDSMPISLATDGSGNVWFVELNGNKLGYIPAAGVGIKEISLPTVRVNLANISQNVPCGPASVEVSPEGNIWVACLFSNELVEFSPSSSSFMEFPLPLFQSGPVGMAFDANGNLWFTAADVDMIGRAVLSQLRNGTSSGITEFAPINQTYVFAVPHPTGFLASEREVIRSSLPTPSGIAIGKDGRTLWITEHVDSSFDSYNTETGSLDRYWTSRTNGAFGYSVSFPNGIAVDGNGNVWVAEHYGNKIAEFNPETDQLTETPVPCCNSTIAGAYSLAVAKDGSVWFVEINGNAIGEIMQEPWNGGLSLTVPSGPISIGRFDTKVVMVNASGFGEGAGSLLRLELSGVGSNGILQNATESFSPKSLFVGGENSESMLTIYTSGLKAGAYYLTLSAIENSGYTYGVVLKLSVSVGAPYLTFLEASISLSAAAVVLLTFHYFRKGMGGRLIRK
jgi:streptogramin lyase